MFETEHNHGEEIDDSYYALICQWQFVILKAVVFGPQ